MTKRLRHYAEYIFTFLGYPYVSADTNFGERLIDRVELADRLGVDVRTVSRMVRRGELSPP